MLDETETIRKIYLELKTISDLEFSLLTVIKHLQQQIDIEAISIRMHKDGDFPYFVYSGFDKKFIQHEMFLCVKDFDGKRIQEPGKNSFRLECMCGNIIRGRTNPDFPFFTRSGSFWSSNTTKLLATTIEENSQIYGHNYCNGCGYESVALIPIHAKGITIGLIQLNDHRIGKFDSDRIEFLEMIGDIIGSKILDNDEILLPDFQDFNNLLITICSFCRRAKLESMKWISLEEYFSKVENIEKISFSHGVCPNCLPLFDPDYQGIIENEKKS